MVTAIALSCHELVELVTDYFEGALRRRTRRRFEAHIAGCPDCTVYVEQLRAIHEQLGRLQPSDVPPAVEQALSQALRAWREH